MSSPVRSEPTASSVDQRRSCSSAAGAADDAAEVTDLHRSTLSAKKVTAYVRSARQTSARASVRQAKSVVGKAVWQKLDKPQRVKVAAEVGKWLSTPRPAAQIVDKSSTAGSVSPPGTPVGVKIRRTVEQLQDMRLNRRKKTRAPKSAHGVRLRESLGNQLAVTPHGVSRELVRSHTPPKAPPS